MGFCTDQVIGGAQAVLMWIFVSALLGFVWHVLMTRRLSFVDFDRDEDKDTLRAKELARLVLPFILVVAVSMLLPFLYYTFFDESHCLRDPDVNQFIKFPWNTLVPAREWSTTLVMDGLIGAVCYWILGLFSWLASR